MQIFHKLLSYLLLCVLSLVNIAGVSAQTVSVLGEIQSTGKVFINSSTGQWVPAMPTYPLLHDTGIKTEGGIASIFFKDASRVDLFRETLVTIAHTPSKHSIKLSHGIILFNITPSSYLSVSTASADILTSAGKEAVVGKITVRGTCLEVQSLAGNIQVNSPARGTQLLKTGENAQLGDCSLAALPAYLSEEITAKYIILSGMGILLVDSLLKSPYILNRSDHGDISRGLIIQW